MLKTLREKAKYFYFLFFLVIITFVFWGVGTVDKPKIEYVAEVDGQKIYAEKFWRNYEELRRAYREVFGEKASEMDKDLKERVLEDLINEEVLLWIAKKYDIEATDKEVQNAIINDPRFMRNGVFQKDIYFQILKLNRMTPAQYEAYLKREITIGKTLQLIASAKGKNEISDEVFIKAFLKSVKENIPIKINKEAIS
ncbi:MAG: SurA N-terminal domain-containing protein [Thermodesulfovibrio sp.]|uniref:SurA N-terminal domain-containing protein n=1 Tax=unclassified Thermodesulfovibrio TaxID=2645936 RepID=UPI00083AD379|nr:MULTISPECIES: SurA N-terminal domain-containing protein [unclassified Thermodesulfovibrio]MDI1472152.1 SurA N-terminal domain-containing protein [Thermodesulfovibrio sp. 1176]MDI6715245.1 SurA N-terminal domain-containing protein [Thermodesulfovibrio sp.]ODA45098.1 Peptidyl-prolyl cis-trans isomerase PpiD [Thermodesulfovibrio sp. N1]